MNTYLCIYVQHTTCISVVLAGPGREMAQRSPNHNAGEYAGTDAYGIRQLLECRTQRLDGEMAGPSCANRYTHDMDKRRTYLIIN